MSVFVATGCVGHRDIRLLESTEQGGAALSGGGSGSGGTTGAGALAGASSVAGGEGAVMLPNPLMVSRNLMIIKPYANLAGQSWELSQQQQSDLSTAFTVTFPSLVGEFSARVVVFDNQVIIDSNPVTSVGYNDDMVEPENVLGWEALVGASGDYDCVYLISARPQLSIYARYDLTSNPIVGWVSDGPRADLSKYGDAMASWLFGWLAVAEIFYREHLQLNNVPGINDSDSYGYTWSQGGLDSLLYWYRDYLNGAITSGGEQWGLGEAAWSLGTLRDWAAQQ